MDLEFSEEQLQLGAAVRDVLERECPIAVVRQVVEGDRRPAQQLWRTMVDLGWPALTVPEAQGGLGMGFVELAVVLEELGRAVAPGPFLPTVAQFAPLVAHAGSAEQRARLLGAVARGELTGSLAVSEATGGWPPHPLATVALPQPDGAWILNGSKHFVIEGATADLLAVVASTPDGMGVFVVPGPVTARAEVASLDASRGLATVTLDSVRVPAGDVLGVPGMVDGAVAHAVECATVAMALEVVGTCQSIFDVALGYAKQREQFGVPIGSFQSIKHKFADMLIALERARVTAYFGALTIAEDDPRRAQASSMAKAAAGDCQRLLAKEGIQVMGGIGYTWEHDMHLYVKRAKSGEPLFGAASAHRARLAGSIASTGPAIYNP